MAVRPPSGPATGRLTPIGRRGPLTTTERAAHRMLGAGPLAGRQRVTVRGGPDRPPPSGVTPDAFAAPGPAPPAARLSRFLRPDAVFAGMCLVLGAVRLSMLAAAGAPPGIDGGNWLAIGRGLFDDAAGISPPVYPPVVPVLVAGAVALAGPTVGIALVASLASLAPAAGVYAVLRREGSRWVALALAALVLSVASTGEAAAWGGYPQLLAVGAGTLALSRLDRHLRDPSRRGAGAVGVWMAVVLATSHFVGLIVIAAAAVLVSVHGARARRAPSGAPARRPRHLALAVLPCLPLVPLYVGLATSIHGGYSSRPAGARVTPTTLLADLEFVYREAPLHWRLLVSLAVLTPLLAGPLRRRPLWSLSTAMVLAVSAVLLATGETRALYVLPVAAVLATGFWLAAWSSGPSRPGPRMAAAIAAVAVAAVSLTSLRGLDLFAGQRSYYQVLAPGVVDGIEWLRANTAPGDRVAVASVRGAPLGWWVEGLGRRPALSASALQWLYVEGERERARVANRVFGPRFPDPSAMDAARAAGVDLLLVARTADVYQPGTVAAFRRSHGALFVYENDDVVILAVPPGRPAGRPAP